MTLIGVFSSAGAAAFSPAALPGIQIVLDASTNVTKDASNFVTAWGDQSTNALSFTSAGALLPTWVDAVLNGKPVIRFARSKSLENATGVISQSSPFSVMMVVRYTTLNNWDIFLKLKNTGGTIPPSWAYSNQAGYSDLYLSAPSTWALIKTTAVVSGWRRLFFTYNGSAPGTTANHAWKIDGTAATLAAASADGAAANTNLIGNTDTGSLYGLSGDVAALYVGNQVWSGTDLSNLEAYIFNRFGI